MEYKLGIDRIAVNGDEENFPYPLKLEYDKENEVINIKLLRLPEYGVMTNDSKVLLSNIYDYLYLIIEVADGYPSGNNKYTRKSVMHNTGGKFHKINNLGYQKIVSSQTLYQFNASSDDLIGNPRGIKKIIEYQKEKYNDVSKYYTKVRASLVFSIGFPSMNRLHVYSNELMIWHTI